jgi:hypothetical protein
VGLVRRSLGRRGGDVVRAVLEEAAFAVARMHAANRAMEEALVRADLAGFFRALRGFDRWQRRYDEAARRWEDVAQLRPVGALGLPDRPVRCEPVPLPLFRWHRLLRGRMPRR